MQRLVTRTLTATAARSTRVSCLSAVSSVAARSTLLSSSSSVRHFASSSPTTNLVARYEKFGPADTVVKLKEEDLPSIQANQVLIQFLAAPINPADINMIEGVYNIQPPLPAVGGNEGVAKVVEIGSNVKGLSVGDWVIPALPGFGTWRKYAICDEEDVDPIEKDVPIEFAATISVNPCSAYRMLHDYTTLKSGDLIIQNGANSSVGMAVIQIAKHMGVKTINVVRDRPNLAELVARLESLGANIVITDETLANPKKMEEIFAKMADKGKETQQPILGLNCVGGASASDITRLLKDGSSMVTYGGMGRKPVCIPTGRLIFNDISIRGFWLSRWTQTHNKAERRVMIKKIMELVKSGEYKTFVQLKPFDQFEAALNEARQGFKDSKVVLTFGDKK